MILSEKFENIKFTKSVAGYNQKEVDGFIADVLPLIHEEETLVAALRAKLAAFEGKSDEIRQKEQEAYRLLEAAKEEAAIIVATAKKSAESIVSDARVASEVQQRAASARAAEILSNADIEAKTLVGDANVNAQKIVSAADARGRELLAKVKALCDEEERKAKALANECADFENRFRTIVADTARALANIKENAPVPCEPKAPKVQEQTETVTEEPVQSQVEEVETEVPVPVKIQPAKREESHSRKLYDTVNITYENEEDDFSDIRNIMNGRGVKSPTHFSE